MIRAVALLPLLCGCGLALDQMPPELPCEEARIAIVARTAECTGDDALAQARYEQFDREYRCIPSGPSHPNPAVADPDLFHCAFAIRQLPCELVEAFGDDLDRYLGASDVCPEVVERVDGEPIAWDTGTP